VAGAVDVPSRSTGGSYSPAGADDEQSPANANRGELSKQRSTAMAEQEQLSDNPVLTQADRGTDHSVATSGAVAQAGCSSCGATPGPRGPGASSVVAPPYVYAIGRIEARFPSLAAEKEFAQATGRADTAGKTDHQTLQTVLSKRENRYLVRQLCWVLTVQGLETYLLVPRDPADIDLLVEAIRPGQDGNDIDVVIGIRGPLASPALCNGLIVPIVAFEQIYSFNRRDLIKAIPKPDATAAAQFEAAAEEVFNRIMEITDNAGATDEHRALNYLAMRYPAMYAKAAEEFGRDRALTAVDVRPAPVAGPRTIVDVVCAYTHRSTDFTEKYHVRVDVTEQFPFLVKKMSPYYDREIGGSR
jgi:hypothetical protein